MLAVNVVLASILDAAWPDFHPDDVLIVERGIHFNEVSSWSGFKGLPLLHSWPGAFSRDAEASRVRTWTRTRTGWACRWSKQRSLAPATRHAATKQPEHLAAHACVLRRGRREIMPKHCVDDPRILMWRSITPLHRARALLQYAHGQPFNKVKLPTRRVRAFMRLNGLNRTRQPDHDARQATRA
jgi:hypothetical protein